ncbi:hypothetical protein [Chthonobacter albigriseus]|uniref:hypothetical protein n=1 Tax=Chthonobacter albigriseus TaxID=1683161 RepID=UPI0015EF3918|nr:hypothetical protein [Chthonobacter albigriseus]
MGTKDAATALHAIRASLRRWGLAALTAILIQAAGAAGAQEFDPNHPIPPADIPAVPTEPQLPADPLQSQGLDPTFGLPSTDPLLPQSAAPYAPPGNDPSTGPTLNPLPDLTPTVVLTARLVEGGAPLKSGVVWRIFGVQAGSDGALPLVATTAGGVADIRLQAGVYLAHCNFGYASSTTRIEVREGVQEESVVLNAGGLKLLAFAEDRPLPVEDVRFDIYSLEIDGQGERKAVALDVAPDKLLRLPAATYHVVSRYGEVNARTRADVEVKAGKMSEVTLYQKAAEVTLKLVGEPGGEAIADTQWSVLTPGGDVVTEGVGAFPSFILASGTYTVVAKHDEALFQREFEVETGRDAEIEVLAASTSATQ